MRPAAACLIVVFVAFACSSKPPTEAGYKARIAEARLARNAAFKGQSEFIPENLKPSLLPLVYYSIDARYDVAAALTPTDGAPPMPMVYSDGAIRNVRRVGTLTFVLNGRALELGGFVEVGAPEKSLFIPFGDLTNGTETYPGGRLLDVERTVTGLYDLDFNHAYNPTCYFNPAYSCPVPPKENRLPVAIQAGERIKTK